MMKTMKILILLVLVLSTQPKVRSQDNSALMVQIESSIAKQEPRWKPLRRSQTRKGDYRGMDWKSGKSYVSIFVAFYKSSEDAANHFKGLPGFFDGDGLIMTVLPTTIPNLGDENYTWEDRYDKRFKGVDFRKGKIVVHVNAPSIELAQRFASHIAEVITANTSVTGRANSREQNWGQASDHAIHQ